MFAAAPEHLPEAYQLYYSGIPLWITVVPMLAGIGIYFIKDSWEKIRKAISLLVSIFSLVGVVLLFPLVLSGTVCFDLLNFMQLGLFFEIENNIRHSFSKLRLDAIQNGRHPAYYA